MAYERYNMLLEIGAERVRGTHDVVTMTVTLGAAMGLADNSLAAGAGSITSTERMHNAILRNLKIMSVTSLRVQKPNRVNPTTLQKCFSCEI